MRISDWSSDVCSSDLTPAKGKKSPSCRPSQPNKNQHALPSTSPTSRSDTIRFEPKARATNMNDNMAVTGRPSISMVNAGTMAASSAVKKARLSMARSEEHTSELQSLMRISYAVFCLKKKKTKKHKHNIHINTIHNITTNQ